MTAKSNFMIAAIAAVLTFGLSLPAGAACINTGTGMVDDINDCLQTDKGSGDCLIAWSLDFDGAGGPPPDDKKIECRDGDPCDADGAPDGVCTFHVGACVNTSVAGCSTGLLTDIEFKKPSAKDALKSVKRPFAGPNRTALLNNVASLLPAATEGCSSDMIEFIVPLKTKGGTCNSPAGEKCSTDLDCDDYCIPTYKKGKDSIKVGVGDGADLKDSDGLKFTCLPGDPANNPGATCDAGVFEITDTADLIGGPLAMGRTGDWMVRNSKIRSVVRDIGREHSFMLTYGGHLIDADLVRADPMQDRDHWTGIQNMVHLLASQNTDMIAVSNDGTDCGPAVLTTSGPDDLFDVLTPELAIFQAGNTLSVPDETIDRNLPIDMSTDYTILPGRNFVEIKTKITNNDVDDLNLFVGDFVNAGGTLEQFGPGLGFGEPLLRLGTSVANNPTAPQSLDYLAWSGTRAATGVAYGLVFPPSPGFDGATGKLVNGTYGTGAFVQSGVAVWAHAQPLLGLLNSVPSEKPDGPFTVPGSGGENSLRRWFVVGETINDVTRMREEMFGNKLGVIQGRVTATPSGDPVPGARVAFLLGTIGNRCASEGLLCKNVFSATATDENGDYRAFLPAGTYNVQVRGPGFPYESSASTPGFHQHKLKGNKTIVQDIELPETGALQVTIVDQSGSPIAGKVSIVGREQAPDPRVIDNILGALVGFGRLFGYEVEDKDTDVFGVVKALFTDQSGDTGTFPLEPGDYHVVVSHGQEYDVYDEAITITSGATTVVSATVNQVIDTTGFVSIDTHVHMLNSADSAVSIENRIKTMLAEGVDFFVPSDHDFVHDVSDDITAMGASSLIASSPSDEITTFVYGHYNVWPLTVDTGSIIGGAFDWGRAGEPGGAGYVGSGSYDVPPADIFGNFNPATQVIQINHFNSPTLGVFNNLGYDTEAIPPVSSNLVYRCDAGVRVGLPCEPEVCIGGTLDGSACTSDPDCTGGGTCHVQPLGRDCPAGVCVDTPDNLSSYVRLDPALANIYDDGYTALEVWIEANRTQTERMLNDNFGDWATLINQGIFKTGIADSDTHHAAAVQAGTPRTYIASATDDPGSIVPATLALNVNAGRAIGSNGVFMTVSLEGDGGAMASHALGDPLSVAATGGAGTIHVHLESPTWAEYDTVDLYINSVADCVTGFNFMGVADRECTITPDVTLTAGTDFTITPTVGVSGFGTRLVADISHPVVVSADTWVIAVAKGTDAVSKPLFPVNPQDLAEMVCDGGLVPDGTPCTSNGQCGFGLCKEQDLDLLTDGGTSPPWNLRENGNLATAYSNPLFFDFEGDTLCHGGTACP